MVQWVGKLEYQLHHATEDVGGNEVSKALIDALGNWQVDGRTAVLKCSL